MDPHTLRAELEAAAKEIGLDAFGVTGVEVPLRRRYYEEWIGQGKHGEMQWMERNNDRRLAPAELLPEARSILCLGLNYYQDNPERRGRIARYALGKDYHKVLLQKLKALCTIMREKYGGEQRPYVDTGPVLEKPIAALAGLGWQGKSTILINRKSGTWLFLGIIVTTLELPANTTPPKDNCGKCTRCIDACPTGAITAPYQLDARRCIAYLTIEHKGAIPLEYRHAIGDRLYGCDECLDVCPWNHWAHQTREAKFAARPLPDLTALLRWSQEEFDDKLAGTPIRRLGLPRWKRNTCVVLGNIGTTADIPHLQAAADSDATEDGLVREHALWAIEQIGGRSQPTGTAAHG